MQSRGANPSCTGVSGTMKRLGCIFPKIFRNRQPQEQRNSRDEEIPHRVHVCKLQEGQPHRSCNGEKKNKLLYAHSSLLEREPHVGMFYHVLPTRPNKTQYMAAKIVNGIEAKSAPNFPVMCDKEIERVRAEWEEVYILLCFKTQKLT